MKVSIITAAFNSSATICDTLKSVSKQDYHNIEHVIVDGLSTDDTIKIAKTFPHLSKIISEKDFGIYDAMNKGIVHSTGDIIGILNSDDYYTYDSVITDIVNLFEGDKNLMCVYADLAYISQNNPTKIVRKWKSGNYDRKQFLMGWMPPHPTFFVRKELYQQFGMFNISLKTAADYELMLRLLYKYDCKCAYLPKTIIKMRNGGASNQSILSRIQANKQDRTAWEINGLKPKFYTLWLKPLRKICQYFKCIK